MTYLTIPLSLAVILAINSFVLSWICLSVPDWLQYNSNGYPVKIGLWNVCIGPISFFSNYECTSWLKYPTKTPGKQNVQKSVNTQTA